MKPVHENYPVEQERNIPSEICGHNVFGEIFKEIQATQQPRVNHDTQETQETYVNHATQETQGLHVLKEIQETQGKQGFQKPHANQDTQSIQETHEIDRVPKLGTSFTLARRLEIAAKDAAEELTGLLDSEQILEYQVMFRFARKIKAMPDMDSEHLNSPKVKKVIKIFCTKMAENYGQHVDFTDTNERWFEFVDAWDKIICAEGENILTMAFEQAKDGELYFEPERGEDFSLLGSVAYYLQVIQQEDPIFLPVGPLAEFMHRSKMHISRVIGMLVRYEIIADVDPDYSFKNHKAKTYRFVFERKD